MRCRHRFQYYKSTLQTKECDAAREARAKAISILQKYSSNKWKIKTFRKLRLNFNTTKVLFKLSECIRLCPCTKGISILQKYSSNQESATQTYDDDQNFNTTKVLFKHDITAYTFYKAIIFQYYKSTLQTLEPAIKEKIETQFQYYKSTLQTRRG